MTNANIKGLTLQEKGFFFNFEEEGDESRDQRWCLVGRFLCDRPAHVISIKVKIANMWMSMKGVTIKQANNDMFLFHFAHNLGMERL